MEKRDAPASPFLRNSARKCPSPPSWGRIRRHRSKGMAAERGPSSGREKAETAGAEKPGRPNPTAPGLPERNPGVRPGTPPPSVRFPPGQMCRWNTAAALPGGRGGRHCAGYRAAAGHTARYCRDSIVPERPVPCGTSPLPSKGHRPGPRQTAPPAFRRVKRALPRRRRRSGPRSARGFAAGSAPGSRRSHWPKAGPGLGGRRRCRVALPPGARAKIKMASPGLGSRIAAGAMADGSCI